MPDSKDEDYELLQKIANGDSKSFESLYNKHKSGLFGYCVSLVGDRMRAQDIYQETWIKVTEHASTYQPRNSFKSWMFRISRNLFLNQVSRDKWEEKVTDEELNQVADVTHIEQDFLKKEQGQWLMSALNELSEQQRVAFVLFVAEDLNHSEISEQMNLTVNHVKVLIHRAKLQLEKSLKGVAMDNPKDSLFQMDPPDELTQNVMNRVKPVLAENKRAHTRKLLWQYWIPGFSTVSLSVFGWIILNRKTHKPAEPHSASTDKSTLDFQSFVGADLDEESLELAENLDVIEDLEILEAFTEEES